jgi:hypothetical protein
MNHSLVALTGTTVLRRIAVEHFTPWTGIRHADIVPGTVLIREIADNKQRPGAGAVPAKEADDALAAVAAVDPFESLMMEVKLMA